MRHPLRRRIRRGQAIVEYALVLPFLMLLIFGMIEGGRLFLAWHQAAGCARRGAREACLWYQTTPDTVVQAVHEHARLAGASGDFKLAITIGNSGPYTYDTAAGGWDSVPTPLQDPNDAGHGVETNGVPVKVKVTLPFNKIWPFGGLPNEVSDYEVRYTEGEPARS